MQNEITSNTSNSSSTFTKTIWASKKELFLSKVERLNRILKKYGKAPITCSFENYRTRQVTFTYHSKGDAFANDIQGKYHVEYCDAVCSGLTVVQKDDKEYIYLGSVSFKDGPKSIFVKDEAYLEYFDSKFRDNMCDHCGTSRRRNTYHLFATDNGKTVLQIGSACAKEYFGISSDAFLTVQMNTFFVTYEGGEDELRFSQGSTTFSYGEIYTFLDFLTKGFTNWNKKGDYDYSLPIQECPTVQSLRDILEMPSWKIPSHYYGKNPHMVSIEEALAYWVNQPTTAFSVNCREALKAGYCTSHTLGSFAWAIFAAVNAKVKAEIAKQVNAENSPCNYPVGKRVSFNAKVLSVTEYEVETFYTWKGEWTTKYAVNIKDENNTLYHISTASTSFSSLKPGDSISIAATIGETKPFKGIDYTRLLRPRVKSISSATDAA